MTIERKRDMGFVTALFISLFSSELLAQDGPINFNSRSTFDKAPWVSARAAALSEAVSPFANGQEAPYYNPAAIGGLFAKPSQAAISELYFPYFGAAADASSIAFSQKLLKGQNLSDPNVASELIRAADGENPYARISVAPSITVKRMFLAYSYDVRAASSLHDSESDDIDVDYRTQSGPLLGFSLASSNRMFYLGVTAAYVERSQVQGRFPLANLSSESVEGLQASKYAGSPVHIGTIWHMPFRGRPTMSLVMKNFLNTDYKSKDPELLPYKDMQNTTLGFGLSPNVGSWGMLNWVLEADHLGDSDPNFSKKFRTGAEVTMGDAFGSRAGLAFRVGYRYAGPSFGLGFNLGMLGLQLASTAEDIGVGGARVIERRSVVNFAINIAD